MMDWIVPLIAWSLLVFVIGINIRQNDDAERIEMLEKSRDFHKAHKDSIIDDITPTVIENHSLRKMNDQLIDENKKLKKELDKQSNTTYNIFY